MTSLTVAAASTLSDTQLAEVEAIYEDSFSSNLRVPFSELSRETDIDRMFVAAEAVATYGGLDVVVLNGGGPPVGPATGIDLASAHAAFDLITGAHLDVDGGLKRAI